MNRKPFIGLALVSVLLLSMVVTVFVQVWKVSNPSTFKQNAVGVSKFTSAEDFLAYYERGQALGSGSGFGLLQGTMDTARSSAGTSSMTPMKSAESQFNLQGDAAPVAAESDVNRVSSTNVQVLGIDEPDIVKTNGKQIFVSQQGYGYFEGSFRKDAPLPQTLMLEDDAVETTQVEEVKPVEPSAGGSSGSAGSTSLIAPDVSYPAPTYQSKTYTFQAYPVEGLKELGSIDEAGELLIDGKLLMVVGQTAVTGYDISNPASPTKKWQEKLGENFSLSQARLYKGKLYIVAHTGINIAKPCPLRPLMDGKEVICADIYRPSVDMAVDGTYHVIRLNPETGKPEDSLSLVGSQNNTIVSMSETALYISYYRPADEFSVLSRIIEENKSFFPDTLVKRVEYIKSLDISTYAKQTEISTTMQQIVASKTSAEQADWYNQMEKRSTQFMTDHKRELDFTSIVKISVPNLAVTANGTVPGQLLNQFAIDEHEGAVRVATTVGRNGSFGTDTSANDVYVFTGALQPAGKVLDMGKGERVYAVRFLGKVGYVVTFKQTDPFYVLDLSDPQKPQLKGELKIPGYSSYLHPLSDSIIVGIGKEDGKLKVSLFDVSNPEQPKDVDTYQIDDFDSYILRTHHAFLNDSKHNLIFVPGGQRSYVLSYAGNKLSMAKQVEKGNLTRALYINDILYLVGSSGVQAYDEKTWELKGEIKKDIYFPVLY